jgi:hypothetical protein
LRLLEELFDASRIQHAHAEIFELRGGLAAEALLGPGGNRAEALFDLPAQYDQLALLKAFGAASFEFTPENFVIHDVVAANQQHDTHVFETVTVDYRSHPLKAEMNTASGASVKETHR